MFGGAVWALSLLLGAVAGNPFGTVLLRSVLSAAGGAAVAAGASMVIRRYLPEILDWAGPASGASATEAGIGEAGDRAGGGVDIVMGEENPHLRRAGDAQTALRGSEGEQTEYLEGEPPEGEPIEAEPVEVEPVETEEGADAFEAVEDAGAVAEDLESDADGVEEIPEDLSDGEVPDGENLDRELPDIEAGTGPPGSAPRAALGEIGSGTVEVGGQQQDVEVVAKAVRTMMRRDQRG